MKKALLIPLICIGALAQAQQELTGTVLDSVTAKPLTGIRIEIPNTKSAAVTDGAGRFRLSTEGKANAKPLRLSLTGKGYSRQILITEALQRPLTLYISPKITDIQEVTLSTGYQKIPRERATGSFSSTNKHLLQQQVTTNILDRLPALISGLTVNTNLTGNGQLMIRGLSTMLGPKGPLIVVDNFPYEGDLNRINPEMVESITVLKDAAASSIWGARAANGVIVITTKTARFSQPLSIEFSTGFTTSSKPDLSYSRQMSSSDFIDVEAELFKKGYYNSDINSVDHPVLTPVVELLNKEKKGIISHQEATAEIDRLRRIDVRDQYRKYMYLPAENRQYAVNVSGGSPHLSWTSFLGYDDNSGNLGEKYRRLSTRLQNNWRPFEKLTVTTGFYFTRTGSESGRSAYNSITMKGNWKIPYLEFADKDGNPLVVNSDFDQEYKNSLAGSGLLDWNYYPLTDWQHTRVKNTSDEILIDAGLNYKLLKGLEADIKHQYQSVNGQNNALNDAESYVSRHLTNSYAQRNADGTLKFAIPKGAILTKGNTQTTVNNIRGQLNYNAAFNKHHISAIAGTEARRTVTKYESNRYYGYNPSDMSTAAVDYTRQYPHFVTGANNYIEQNISLRETQINFLSFYANAAYTFDKRYTVTGSIRRDASNLFGLKTNEQWNPFWSAGAAWNIAGEKFYNAGLFPVLKVRGSYGFNGNVDPAMVAVTTIAYDPNVSVYTGDPTARIDQYYNPRLRWEMLKIVNLGLDFATVNHRISGSFEYYTKNGSNLFGLAPIDYTTGITTLLWNVAGMKGKGIDVTLNTKNIDKALKWNTVLNYSTYRDEVTAYYLPTTFASNFVAAAGSTVPVSGIIGLPVYSVFAYKWAGLDPENGDPRGYLNGEVSKDYSKIMASDKGIEDLQYLGSAVPTTFGSFINSLFYKQFSMDIGITYKLGYRFRRSSINYTSLITGRNGHSDYATRWQRPGDEKITDTPSNPFTANSARDAFYNGSSVLIEKGDHVRLQYINFGYVLGDKFLASTLLKNLRLYCSVNNLGLLWKANKAGIDPDYSWGTYSLKSVTTYSFGLRAQF